MFRATISQCRTAILLLLMLTLITGIFYPVFITVMAQLLFPNQANGSLITKDNKIVGSALIGQQFTDPRYLWGRPSATSPNPYNAASSSGSNFGPSNPLYFTQVEQRIQRLRDLDPLHRSVPVDLVTASGSGLDPEISPLSAVYQVPRIAKARGITEQEIMGLIQQQALPRSLGILGEPRINVLAFNLALDAIKNVTTPPQS